MPSWPKSPPSAKKLTSVGGGILTHGYDSGADGTSQLGADAGSVSAAVVRSGSAADGGCSVADGSRFRPPVRTGPLPPGSASVAEPPGSWKRPRQSLQSQTRTFPARNRRWSCRRTCPTGAARVWPAVANGHQLLRIPGNAAGTGTATGTGNSCWTHSIGTASRTLALKTVLYTCTLRVTNWLVDRLKSCLWRSANNHQRECLQPQYIEERDAAQASGLYCGGKHKAPPVCHPKSGACKHKHKREAKRKHNRATLPVASVLWTLIWN